MKTHVTNTTYVKREWPTTSFIIVKYIMQMYIDLYDLKNRSNSREKRI